MSGESSDKCAAVAYVYYNTAIKNCTFSVPVHNSLSLTDNFSEHPASDLDVVLKLQKWTPSRLYVVCWRDEAYNWHLASVKERKDYSLEMCGIHDQMDAFPQSMVNSSFTTLHSIVISFVLFTG